MDPRTDFEISFKSLCPALRQMDLIGDWIRNGVRVSMHCAKMAGLNQWSLYALGLSLRFGWVIGGENSGLENLVVHCLPNETRPRRLLLEAIHSR
jgi:hypothetical protein